MSTATHAGDFGNLTASSSGTIHTDFTTSSITVAPGNRSVVGKAVLLHASPDDLTSQPSGNSGARVACGVAMAQ
jgi:Cu-Zn family superoxide dismutase